MASRGHGRRGHPRSSSRPPPGFDQQAFIEAMGATTTAISHASAARGQGGPSNLQRFIAHYPPTFTGGGDPVVVVHWFRQVEMIFEATEITSDATQIRITTF